VRPVRTREDRRRMALALWGGFVRCPVTKMILEILRGDTSVYCQGCQRTHRVYDCPTATVDEYLDEYKGGRK
jgi:hypothetical protein